jgi:hypothetical protein
MEDRIILPNIRLTLSDLLRFVKFSFYLKQLLQYWYQYFLAVIEMSVVVVEFLDNILP